MLFFCGAGSCAVALLYLRSVKDGADSEKQELRVKPVPVAMVMLLIAGMVACGGSSTTTSTLSGFKNRAFVTNTYAGRCRF